MASNKSSSGRGLRRSHCLLLAALVSLLDPLRVTADNVPGYNSQQDGAATFYGGADSSGTWGGACGYGNLLKAGYGMWVAAGSEALFKGGNGCGSCYRIKCKAPAQYCNGQSIVVPITDLCPGGGWCGGGLKHFDLSEPAFSAIADRAAGHVELSYERVPCTFSGSMKFIIMEANAYWLNVLVENVAGPGDIGRMQVKPDGGDWKDMVHIWGANWVFNGYLRSPLALRVTSLLDNQTVTTGDTCVPKDFAGGTYDCGVQFSYKQASSECDKKLGCSNTAPPRPPPVKKTPPAGKPSGKGHHPPGKGHHASKGRKSRHPPGMGHHVTAGAGRKKGHHPPGKGHRKTWK